jgi:hypothetical protein
MAIAYLVIAAYMALAEVGSRVLPPPTAPAAVRVVDITPTPAQSSDDAASELIATSR